MALQADVSCAFTQMLSLLEEEADEPLWRTFLEEPFIEEGEVEEPFIEGSCCRQQLNCRSFSKAAMHRGAGESSKRETTPFALFIGLLQPN